MKKLLSILLIVAMLISSVLIILPITAADGDIPVGGVASDYKPSGTPITSEAEWLAMTANNSYYLANDIVVDEAFPRGWNKCAGIVIDGNGKKITYTGTTSMFDGCGGATVKNLTIEGTLNVTTGQTCVGVLANGWDGNVVVDNVLLDVDITVGANQSFVGGLFGKLQNNSDATITNVVNRGTITSTTGFSSGNTGGIVGYFGQATAHGAAKSLYMENCVNEGDIIITGRAEAVGGIVGSIGGDNRTLDNTKIINCTNKGKITVSGETTAASGGIVGNATQTTIKGCVNDTNATITVTGTNAAAVAGISGTPARCYIEDCVNNAAINISGIVGWGKVGGIAGDISTTLTVKNTTNNGNITVTAGNTTTVGGIIALLNAPDGRLEGCVNNGKISVTAPSVGYIGGIAGWTKGTRNDIVNCINAGDVEYKVTSGRSQVGGIVGFDETTTLVVDNCDTTVESSVYAEFPYDGAHKGVGGIIGTSNVGSTEIKNCDNKGTVTLKNTGGGNSNVQVGGILGRANNLSALTVTNCTNSAAITHDWTGAGWDGAAGIVGTIADRSAATTYTFTNCINTGAVTTPSIAGGIFGNTIKQNHADISMSFTNCMNTGDISSSAQVAGGIAGSIFSSEYGDNAAYKLNISGCLNTGNVTSTLNGENSKVAGILAKYKTVKTDQVTLASENVPTIKECVNAGTLTASKNSYRPGDTWCGISAGILAFFCSPIQIKDCVNVGTTINNGDAQYKELHHGEFPISNCVETRGNGWEYRLDTTLLSYSGNLYLEGTAFEATNKTLVDSASADKAGIYAKVKAILAKGYDTTAITAEIDKMATLTEADYLVRTWTEYKASVEAAQKALDDYNKAGLLARYQYTLNDAELDMAAKRAALIKKVDFYAPLETAISNAEALVENNYVATTWAPLAEAKATAIAARASEDTAVRDAAIEGIEDAIAALVTKLDDLKATVASTDTLVADHYIGRTWDAMQEKLTAAKALCDANSTDIAAIESAKTELVAAIEGLINVEALNTAINAAKALLADEAKYSAATWAIFEEKLAAAEDVKANGPESDINTAGTELQAAIDALIDVTEFRAYIDSVKANVQDAQYYTDASYTDYTTALNAAEEVYANATSYEAIDEAKAELDAKAEALEMFTMSDDQAEDIENVVEDAETYVEEYYDEQAWEEFTAALEAVEALTANSTMYEVDIALNALEAAKNALAQATVEATEADYEDLENTILDAEALDMTIYMPTSYAKLVAIIEDAGNVGNTKKEVNEARLAIEAAIASLIERPTESAEDQIAAKIEAMSDRNKLAAQMILRSSAGKDLETVLALLDALEA